MPKDYKKPNKKDPQSGGYGWMFSGIALGLLVGLGMYFYSSYQTPSASDTTDSSLAAFGEGDPANPLNGGIQEPDPISIVIENARQEQQDRKRATFSYYAVLPNLELDVNVKPSEKDNPPPEEKITTETIEKVILKPGMHILQIASFKSEAQARRSQKKLKNLETRIEKRKIRGKDWYRLFAGPTQQSADIDIWKALAKKAGYDPLVVKVK